MAHNKTTGFSIIIPTFHEALNIPELAKRIASVDFGQRDFEVLLIDDNSKDGITDVVQQLSATYQWLKLIVRKEERNLSQSVITGFQQASFPILVTIDADLSHPPEEIPTMLALLEQSHIDMVVGSRYISGGSVDEKWPLIRKLTSQSAALIARIVLGVNVKDPLSGFLALRKSTLFAGHALKPIGWKIGLEVMIKCQCKSIREIPIHFSQRYHGTSKLNLKISFAYLQHIVQLINYKLFKPLISRVLSLMQ